MPTLGDELDRAVLEQHINSVFSSVDRLKDWMRRYPQHVTSEDLDCLTSAWSMLGILLVEGKKLELQAAE